ncbi:hypothetical protein J6590_064325 [Homalodisca vitripennis]|nr:hypothetical protein J6590_064325 [Homalodisca vitripennis]
MYESQFRVPKSPPRCETQHSSLNSVDFNDVVTHAFGKQVVNNHAYFYLQPVSRYGYYSKYNTGTIFSVEKVCSLNSQCLRSVSDYLSSRLTFKGKNESMSHSSVTYNRRACNNSGGRYKSSVDIQFVETSAGVNEAETGEMVFLHNLILYRLGIV